MRSERSERERADADARQAFVGGVSHELKTPLTSIRLFAETLALRRGDASAEQKCIEGLEREMIQGALDLARGNISEAARTLGLTRRGLYLKLRRLGFDSEPGEEAKRA